MVNCPRCGSDVPDGSAAAPRALCEACKWASISSQPITNLGLTPAHGGSSLTGSPSLPAAPAVAVAAPVHPQALAAARAESGNLPVAALLAVAAGILAAGAWYGLAVATDILWFSVLIGVAVGFAASYGNGGRGSGATFAVSAAVTGALQMAVLYLVLRHAVVDQSDVYVPLVLSWDQTRSLFTEIPAVPWFITLVWGLAGTVIAWRRTA